MVDDKKAVQNIVLPVSYIYLLEKFSQSALINIAEQIKQKKDEEIKNFIEVMAKDYIEKIGIATGIAIIKEYSSENLTLEEICKIWRAVGFSEINLKKEDDKKIIATCTQLFNEAYEERPYVKGLLEGIVVRAYGIQCDIQKILDNENEVQFSITLLEYSSPVSQSIKTPGKKINFEKLNIKPNKINIVTEERLEIIVNNLLNNYLICPTIIITPIHPKILAEKYKEKNDKFAQIIWLSEGEKKKEYSVISPTRIDHELYAIPRNFFIQERIDHVEKTPVFVLTHLEPFSTFLGSGWENKTLNYLIKIQNLCAEYAGIGLLAYDPNCFSPSFTSRLYRLLG